MASSLTLRVSGSPEFQTTYRILDPKVSRGTQLTSGEKLARPVLLLHELLAQRLAGDPQDFRGPALVRLDPLHDLVDVGTLHLRQRPKLLRPLLTRQLDRLGRELERQVLRLDVVGGAQDDEALDEIAQLADVARPGIGEHEALGLGREPLDRLVRAHVGFCEEVAGERYDVLPPLA